MKEIFLQKNPLPWEHKKKRKRASPSKEEGKNVSSERMKNYPCSSVVLLSSKLHKIADRMHDLRGFYYIWFIVFSQPLAIFQLLVQIFLLFFHPYFPIPCYPSCSCYSQHPIQFLLTLLHCQFSLVAPSWLKGLQFFMLLANNILLLRGKIWLGWKWIVVLWGFHLKLFELNCMKGSGLFQLLL